MDMFRYIRSKIPGTHGESRHREMEFFRFLKSQRHGFPSKPTCLAYDPQLQLLALGTKNGQVRIYGAPGVEYIGQHESGSPVLRLLFLPGQGRLISFCENQTFHLWEANCRDGQAFLDHIKECSASGRMKRISCCGLKNDSDGNVVVLIGTESGNVYAFDVRTFELTDHIIYQDAVMQNVPDDYKVSPGAVEALAVHPSDSNKLLIGYNRGLMVLWDSQSNNAQTFISSQQVESLAWLRRGDRFISSHNDGSYTDWSTMVDIDKPEPNSTVPFGPFPCKPINKIIAKPTIDEDDDFIIFSGGMPRATYGENNTVSVHTKSKQVVFDFSSKVVDFATVENTPEESGNDAAKALLVLCEEELVAIDLESEDWPVFRPPYLQSLHASPITACLHVPDVDAETVLDKLRTFGRQQAKVKFGHSERLWPITGGENNFQIKHSGDLLVTGHEDGSVKFWTAGGSIMELVYILHAARVFQGYRDPYESAVAEEAWPPFRKVGCYDPYSDDPRFGVQRLAFDGREGILVVGGAAGQVSVWNLNLEEREVEFQPIIADLASEAETFVWKGKEQLELRNGGKLKFFQGFAPVSVLQMNPPASVMSVALQSSWGVVGVGTAHGFAVFDYKSGKVAFKRCLLTPTEMVSGVAAVSEGTMSRFKSFKKSLRESFRRRRGPRSPKSTSPEPPKPIEEGAGETSKQGETEAATSAAKSEKKEQSPKRDKKTPTPDRATPAGDDHASPLRPIEREVQARTETAELNSMVRTMYFCSTYILNSSTVSSTLWVGTNGGAVMAVVLMVPETPEKREELGGVQCQLAKEVRLRHHAPVLGLTVVDGFGFPLDCPRPVVTTAEATTPATVTSPSIDGGHRLIVCSEEQIKAFHLPLLKPSRHKFKLTAMDGSRIRKVQFVNLQSKTDEAKWEPFIVTITNQGDIEAFDTHYFRRCLNQNCVSGSDINAILSTVLTRRGEGFYLLNSSEWQRFGISARYAVFPMCSLNIAEGARPQLAAPVTEAMEELKLEPKSNEEHTEPKTTGAADTSVASAGDEPPSHNASALPTDITIDSIRDYTTTSHSMTTESHVTDKGTVTITQKVTKTVHSYNSGDVVSDKAPENILNGNSEEPDEIALEKAKVVTSSTTTASRETKTLASTFTSSTVTSE